VQTRHRLLPPRQRPRLAARVTTWLQIRLINRPQIDGGCSCKPEAGRVGDQVWCCCNAAASAGCRGSPLCRQVPAGWLARAPSGGFLGSADGSIVASIDALRTAGRGNQSKARNAVVERGQPRMASPYSLRGSRASISPKSSFLSAPLADPLHQVHARCQQAGVRAPAPAPDPAVCVCRGMRT